MAKKKKVNKQLLFVLTAAAVCLGFMAFVALFFPAVKMTVEGILGTYSQEVSGIHAVFGGTITEGNEHIQLTVAEYGFNFMAFLGYLLPLIAAALSLLAFKSKGNLLNFVAAGLCLVGAILIFLEPTFFASVNEINEKVVCSLLIGPILGGVFAILAGLFNTGCAVMKK